MNNFYIDADEAVEAIRLIDATTPQISSFVKSRSVLLAKLNSIIRMMNDENAYFEWIETVPDECTFEELVAIAHDEPFFQDVLREFIRIFVKYSYGE